MCEDRLSSSSWAGVPDALMLTAFSAISIGVSSSSSCAQPGHTLGFVATATGIFSPQQRQILGCIWITP